MTETIYTFAMPDHASERPDCWLAQFSGRPCAGRIEHAHLIKQQTLRRAGLGHLVRDAATWAPACRYHHAAWDTYTGDVNVPRAAVPSATELFAERHELGAALDRRFGPRADDPVVTLLRKRPLHERMAAAAFGEDAIA